MATGTEDRPVDEVIGIFGKRASGSQGCRVVAGPRCDHHRLTK